MRGDGFVYKRMGAHFNRAGWASEQIGGVSALLFLRKLVEEIDQDWASVLTTSRTDAQAPDHPAGSGM